jgi:hypothetical protein
VGSIRTILAGMSISLFECLQSEFLSGDGSFRGSLREDQISGDDDVDLSQQCVDLESL